VRLHGELPEIANALPRTGVDADRLRRLLIRRIKWPRVGVPPRQGANQSLFDWWRQSKFRTASCKRSRITFARGSVIIGKL
jgi:hypothetical protein